MSGETPPEAEEALPSGVMAGDRFDDTHDDTGELFADEDELPEEEEHLVPARPDAGFEGWLGGEEDAASAYEELSAEDAEDEIAGWMAFTEGHVASERDDEEPPPGEPSGEPPVAGFDDEDEDTDEFAIPVPLDEDDEERPEVADAAEAVEEEEVFEAAEDGDEEPAVVLESPEAPVVVLPGAEPAAPEVLDGDVGVDGDVGGDQEEGAPEGDEQVAAAGGEETNEIPALGFDAYGDFSDEDFLTRGATSEHAGLAAAIAKADEEADTEKVALAASMPGLDSGVVGFDDVVAAEGQYAGSGGAPRSSDLAVRIGSAVVLIGLLVVSMLWRPALIAFAIVVFILAAGEFYTSLMRKEYRPLALFGFLGIVGASLGAVLWGAVAIPIALALTALVILLFFAVVPGRTKPLLSFGLTMLVAGWVGFGAYAFPIIDSEDWRSLVLTAVALVAIMDIAQYFTGRTLGRHALAPVVSPKKTWEGLVGGVVVVLGLGALLHYIEPFDLQSGLAIGAVVAVVAPVGDLAVSAVKRSLGVKDMGVLLPGHGGILDRIDALLFVIPAAWIAYSWMGLI